MALETKEKTALDASVGADAGQSIQSKSTQIITAEFPEVNDQNEIFQENMDEISHRMQNIGNPNYLHTVSMSELYQTTYKSRPPIVEGLLYAGAYILAGAPKIGKSFLVAQIAYHVSTGEKLWAYTVNPGTVLYLALEDDFSAFRAGCL